MGKLRKPPTRSLPSQSKMLIRIYNQPFACLTCAAAAVSTEVFKAPLLHVRNWIVTSLERFQVLAQSNNSADP